MVGTPVAIPTEWRGITFRSRLEARWAVFFDALGVRYQYEPEGFDIDGTWYLPDFWLPKQSVFVEVKPAITLVGADEWAKIWKFGVSDLPWGGVALLLLNGPPNPEQEGMGPWSDGGHRSYSGIFGPEERKAWFHRCPRCQHLSVESGPGCGRDDRWDPPPLGLACHSCGMLYGKGPVVNGKVHPGSLGDLKVVHQAAVSAVRERFIR